MLTTGYVIFSYNTASIGQRYIFLINNFKFAAQTIADSYKARWQIELLYLKIKTFLGNLRKCCF